MRLDRGTAKGRLGLYASVSMALSCAPGVATAQTAEDAEAAPVGLEEIIVTAQRRTERLQDVPIQVSAFSSAAIEDAGIRSTREVINLVPNVSFDESFTYLNSFVVVRGVTQINNADSPVAVILDGVPQNSQKQLRMNLFDIERIEVLKGPQGGLYGRNAIGGAINIVTRAPTNDFEGFLNASYGRGEALDLTGAVSGPISPDVATFRLAANYKQDNGRIRNSFTRKRVDFVDHDYEIRGKINVRLSTAVDLDIRASYRDFQAGGIYDNTIPSGRADDYRRPNSNIEGLTFGDIFDTSFKIGLDLGGATLTGITAYTELTENYRGDLDFSNSIDKPGGFLGFGFQAGQGQDLGLKLTSQELRLVSEEGQRFRWLVGAYYLHTDRELRTRAFFDLNGSREQIDDPALRLIELREKNNNDAYALYASFDYDLVAGLTLSGALRYDKDQRKQTDIVSGAAREKGFDAVQPKATLTYRFTTDKLAYLTYSTGFRSGGFNAPTVRIPVFEDETLENFEAGFKTSWLNRKLVVNGAVYLAKSRDFQFFFVDAISASQIIGNLDRVNIFGIELEAQALISPGFQLSAAIGTTDSTIKKADDFPAAIGNKTPRTTNWTLNLGAQYKRQIVSGADLLLRLDYQHRGKKYWQIDNSDIQEPLDLVDVRVGLEGERWGLFLAARNILGEKYYADYNSKEFSGLDVDIGFRGQPSTYAAEVKWKF